MDKKKNNRQDIGEIIYEWNDIDHIIPERGKIWYIFALLFILSVIIFGIKDGNYSMSFVFIVIFLVYFITSSKKPFLQKNRITDLGIVIGDKVILYSEIKSFWFIHFKDGDILYIKRDLQFYAPVVIPVIEGDFSIIKKIFLEFGLNESEGRKESLDEIIARKLKL